MTDPVSPPNVLLDQADQAARNGRTAEAINLYERVLAADPRNARALNGLGNRALSAGDAAAAASLFERALREDPDAAPIWLNLAFAERARGAPEAELNALNGALALDPYFMVALLHKAQWFERFGKTKEAIGAYRSLLDAAPPLDDLPPPFQTALRRGKALVEESDREIERKIRAAVGPEAGRSRRFDHALEILGGRRQVFLPKPAGLHYPYLAAEQFFDRSMFPWFGDLERATDDIRNELLTLSGDPEIARPYVNIARGEPENQWQALNNSLDWNAIYLWRDGTPNEEVLVRCPRTAAALSRAQMLDIPGRGPTAMFSTLRPGTHIPPHHGVTNIRAVVHLPLIIPPGCSFRVGSETRVWREGEAWAFDDTIEHEAWNRSDQTRVILIIDAWNPQLDEQERSLLRAAHEVLAATSAEERI